MEYELPPPQDDGDATAVVLLCAQDLVRDLLAYWLEPLPVRCYVARDGFEANRLLKAVRGGLLVTDRVLPPWPGLATFRDILAGNPRLDIAVVEDSSPELTTLARAMGATILLQRPLTRRGVIDALGLPAS